MNIETTIDLFGSPIRGDIIVILDESNSVGRNRLATTLENLEVNRSLEDEKSYKTAKISETASQRMKIALHHNHLPRLAEAGLITYDTQTVTATSQLEAVANEYPWFATDEVATPL